MKFWVPPTYRWDYENQKYFPFAAALPPTHDGPAVPIVRHRDCTEAAVLPPVYRGTVPIEALRGRMGTYCFMMRASLVELQACTALLRACAAATDTDIEEVDVRLRRAESFQVAAADIATEFPPLDSNGQS
ncbi:MAG: hypothetical protein JO344_01760 [Planctomycetaceae bacterium]|nr:hypothetical protein [Planctomycetaceae bacterium]